MPASTLAQEFADEKERFRSYLESHVLRAQLVENSHAFVAECLAWADEELDRPTQDDAATESISLQLAFRVARLVRRTAKHQRRLPFNEVLNWWVDRLAARCCVVLTAERSGTRSRDSGSAAWLLMDALVRGNRPHQVLLAFEVLCKVFRYPSSDRHLFHPTLDPFCGALFLGFALEAYAWVGRASEITSVVDSFRDPIAQRLPGGKPKWALEVGAQHDWLHRDVAATAGKGADDFDRALFLYSFHRGDGPASTESRNRFASTPFGPGSWPNLVGYMRRALAQINDSDDLTPVVPPDGTAGRALLGLLDSTEAQPPSSKELVAASGTCTTDTESSPFAIIFSRVREDNGQRDAAGTGKQRTLDFLEAALVPQKALAEFDDVLAVLICETISALARNWIPLIRDNYFCRSATTTFAGS
jgi:hypothetical protein